MQVETAADRSNPPIVECATSSDVQNESGIDILSLLHENEIENVELNNPGREFNIEFINVDQVRLAKFDGTHFCIYY